MITRLAWTPCLEMIIPWVFCGFYGLMRILTAKPEKEMKEFFKDGCRGAA